MKKNVSSPRATHMVATKKIFKYIRGTHIMEYFSCKMEMMLLFFILMQIKQETLAIENPQLVYSLSNTME
jgi:hypothetical protein